MKQKLLISTIVRQRRKTLPLWRDQILALIRHNPRVEFAISIAENCSTDGSQEFLVEAINTFKALGVETHYLSENLGTPYFGSVKNAHRTELLAAQRNKTLDCPAFATADKLVFIEPDIRFDAKQVSTLLFDKADLISARSTQAGCALYDTWATRLDATQTEWAGSNIPTDRTQVWSTFNCFVVAKAEPFQTHLIRFSGVNPRTGMADCDTVSICEELHKHDCNEVYIHGGITVEHFSN